MAILTISREYGSGGREIGKRVAARLGYRYADKELLFQDLEKGGPRWARVAGNWTRFAPPSGSATTGNTGVMWLWWSP